MKKITIAALSVMLAAGLTAADLKIGTVDLMKLVRNHPNYESNKELLTSTDKDYQKKLDAIKSEGEKMQEDGKALMEKYKNPMLAAKAKADLEKQITDLQKKLMGVDQQYRAEAMRCRQDLQDLEGRLLKATTEDLRKRIKTYAEKNGFDFILDQSAAPYSKDSFDVTPAMLETMGVDPKNVKAGDNEGK